MSKQEALFRNLVICATIAAVALFVQTTTDGQKPSSLNSPKNSSGFIEKAGAQISAQFKALNYGVVYLRKTPGGFMVNPAVRTDTTPGRFPKRPLVLDKN